MTKLLVSPKYDGYQLQPGPNVISTKLDGGPARYRLDCIGNTHEASVQWTLTMQGFNYLMAFYRTEIAYGSLPFEIDLKAIDGAELGTYIAHIVPGTFQMVGVENDVIHVQATLELTPATTTEAADDALIAAGPGD
jgi:hypothetical protein